MDNRLPNFKELNNEEGRIFGRYNTVTSVNPYKCYFRAYYSNGVMIRGNNLFDTGWDSIPQGLLRLDYVLSTGHVIEIPRFIGYLNLIETSIGMDNSRIFHAINIKCLAENAVIVYKIILRQDGLSKFKIGDVIIGKEKSPSWKFTS